MTEQNNKSKIRKFDTGATRDNIGGKLDYMKALSPIVLRRYVQYLDKHRLQPDGSMRDFDNWKKGIPLKTYHSSKGRHFFAAWLLEEGYEVSDNHGPVNEEDALCGELFNTIGRLHEILKAKLKQEKFVCPEGWEIAHNDPGGNHICEWYVFKKLSGYLHKDLQLHDGTGYSDGNYGYGEAPGYWPTEKAAKDALRQYLEK